MPPAQISPMISLIPSMLILGIAILVPLLVLGILRLRKAPTRKLLAAIVAMGIALSALSIAYGYGLNQAYVSSHTWSYSYYVYIRTNSTGPDAIVIPSVIDETLLVGFTVNSGTANWSFVATEHGRGIYVGFADAATLSVSRSQYPVPSPLPDTRWTMTNGSAEQPGLWVFYPGTAGAYVSLQGGLWCEGYLRSGWHLYPTRPVPIAVP